MSSQTLLAVAVQNTHTIAGVFAGGELVSHWRVATDPRRTADEWGLLLGGLLARDQDGIVVGGVAVCSAVPAVVAELRDMASTRFGDAAHVFVGPGVRSGLPMLMDNPREVGTDRVANVVGAVERYGAPCLVVDMGTATTFDAVNPAGQFVGGAIAPGIQVSLEALGLRGAQLRQVELVTPRSVIAKNTVEALQAGSVFGFASQVDGVVTRMLQELDLSRSNCSVVMTGSLANRVIDHCETVTAHEPWLALEGLRVIFDRNRE
jgi:type III pantothenate kinase